MPLQTQLKYLLDMTKTSECKTIIQMGTSARCRLHMYSTSLLPDDNTGLVGNDPVVNTEVENSSSAAPCLGAGTKSWMAALFNTKSTYGHGQGFSLNGVEYWSTPFKRFSTISVLVAFFSLRLTKWCSCWLCWYTICSSASSVHGKWHHTHPSQRPRRVVVELLLHLGDAALVLRRD